MGPAGIMNSHQKARCQALGILLWVLLLAKEGLDGILHPRSSKLHAPPIHLSDEYQIKLRDVLLVLSSGSIRSSSCQLHQDIKPQVVDPYPFTFADAHAFSYAAYTYDIWACAILMIALGFADKRNPLSCTGVCIRMSTCMLNSLNFYTGINLQMHTFTCMWGVCAHTHTHTRADRYVDIDLKCAY